MTIEEFKQTVKDDTMPSNLPAPLHALWIDARGQWSHAHHIVQEESTPEAAWVHAYLHRKEGDESNARHWYSEAGKEMPSGSLDAEWDQIAAALLATLK
jgi:hypothetical protein